MSPSRVQGPRPRPAAPPSAGVLHTRGRGSCSPGLPAAQRALFYPNHADVFLWMCVRPGPSPGLPALTQTRTVTVAVRSAASGGRVSEGTFLIHLQTAFLLRTKKKIKGRSETECSPFLLLCLPPQPPTKMKQWSDNSELLKCQELSAIVGGGGGRSWGSLHATFAFGNSRNWGCPRLKLEALEPGLCREPGFPRRDFSPRALGAVIRHDRGPETDPCRP